MPKIESGVYPAEIIFTETNSNDKQIMDINQRVSAAILAGFDYEISGEILHFSYDTFDQQNFADTANLCLMLKNSAENDTVSWNAYRQNGSQVQLELMPDDFLALYANGALAHKKRCLMEGAAQKTALLASSQAL